MTASAYRSLDAIGQKAARFVVLFAIFYTPLFLKRCAEPPSCACQPKSSASEFTQSAIRALARRNAK